MSSIADRLQELIGDGSVNGFAKQWGVSGTGLRSYLEGSIPSADKAARIAEKAGVSLLWLITGEGPKYPTGAGNSADLGGFSEHQAPYAAGPDPELLGRIVDRIAKVYREEGVRLADVDLGRLAAERYAEVVGLAGDPDEWPGFLEVAATRVRKAIRAAASDPATVKREA